MAPPSDYLNMRYALENNVRCIHFSASLDPIITPIAPVSDSPADIVAYMDFFENADPAQSAEPLIVEYYKLKFKLKSFADIAAELEGASTGAEFFPLQINDFVSNGTTSDLYLAPFKIGEYLEDDREVDALQFFEEAHRLAMRWCNQDGVALCADKIAELKERIDTN